MERLSNQMNRNDSAGASLAAREHARFHTHVGKKLLFVYDRVASSILGSHRVPLICERMSKRGPGAPAWRNYEVNKMVFFFFCFDGPWPYAS